MNNRFPALGFVVAICIVAAGGVAYSYNQQRVIGQKSVTESKLPLAMVPTPVSTPSASSGPTATPTPTPKPLTFAEMNALYGPCVNLPILMYHHIQPEEQAKAAKQTGLTVYTPTFREQMQYLKDKGYTTVTAVELKRFFDNGTTLPAHAVMLTFDDGYSDNSTDMFPVLKEMGFKGTVFMITGLAENPGYLSWGQINEMAGNGIYFGNHTWSHHNMKAVLDVIKKEVGTAETQLSDHALNQERIFAYPYGLMSPLAVNYLSTNGYSMAFDTVSGRIQCAKKKYELTRIRVGNTKLSAYGL